MSRNVSLLSSDVDESRYQIERRLGQGAAGTVYLARDRETGEEVALKKLLRMDAKSVLRLKREFRALMDVAHPNIVKLYDMGRGSDAWFLTMEYLDGVDLTTYLTGEHPCTNAQPLPYNDNARPNDQRRLSAFRQLAFGVSALHQCGMLHRDLKPSNVLVADGRVVLLDFGLVRELSLKAATLTEDGSIAGTPAYMAPEQLKGDALGAACDWYAFGVILYEALSGKLPLDGSLLSLLHRKLTEDPVPLQVLAPGVPGWLSELCMALLQRDPALRPSGAAILAAFEAGSSRGAPVEVPRTATDNTMRAETHESAAATLLFGRENELSMLRRAFDQARTDGAVVVHVRGTSGAGKSALIEKFLEEIELQAMATGDVAPLLLRGRCYELEQLPFKALDAVIDALVHHLSHLDDLEVAHMLPPEIAVLTQLFPALERLRAIKRLKTGSRAMHGAVNDRDRAEGALRQLLDRVSARQPIVLWIDDLQWGDLDSARILRSWMKEPTQAQLLFVFSYRSDEVTTSSCLSRLLCADTASATAPAPEHALDVAALQSADIHALCTQRLGVLASAHPELVARIVLEADGSPFLASQLAALAEAKIKRGDTDLDRLSIDLLVAQTGAMLAPEAKQLLNVLAVAGRPMVPKLALAAAGVTRSGRALVHTLRSLNLVRTREFANERRLEIYHDRVRHSVYAALDADQSARVHQSLLSTLEFSQAAESDWLHTLALGAGALQSALQHGLVAAERANTSLAFERAAELYQRCIELTSAAEAPSLWNKLALALVHCGRGAQAAEAYLEAAKHAERAPALSLTQLAASHFLRSGRFEQGEALMRRVLEEMKCPLPQSPGALMAAIVWESARLKARGLKYVLRAERDAPEDLLAKHDIFSGLYVSIQSHDSLGAVLLQLRALRCALEAGEPRRMVRAFSGKALQLAYSGGSAQEAEALLQQAENLARQHCQREYANVCVVRSSVAFSQGRMSAVLAAASEAERCFRPDELDDPQGNYHSRLSLAAQRVGALYQLGEFKRSESELQALTREARATDNRNLLLLLTLNQTNADAIAGRAAISRVRLDEQARALPRSSFGILHTLHMAAVMHCACATGDYGWARDYLADTWDRYARSPVRRIYAWINVVHGTRCRLLLNEHIAQGRRGGLPHAFQAGRNAQRKLPQNANRMHRLEARLAHLQNNRARAVDLLRQSIHQYTEINWPAEAARERYALGALLEGSEGQELQSAAIQQLHELGVADPIADLRAYYPEFTDAGGR